MITIEHLAFKTACSASLRVFDSSAHYRYRTVRNSAPSASPHITSSI
jgi:hypothetical protein